MRGFEGAEPPCKDGLLPYLFSLLLLLSNVWFFGLLLWLGLWPQVHV